MGRLPSSAPMWITVGALSVGVMGYVTVFGEIAAEQPPATTAPTTRARTAAVAEDKPGASAPAKRAAKPPRRQPSSRFSAAARWRRERVFAQVTGAAGFRRLGEPRPGEWLWSFREPGQTLQDYARRDYRRPPATRRRLHVLPYHDLTLPQRELLPALREYVSGFFGVPVTVLPFKRLAKSTWVMHRQQHDAEVIADRLAKRVPADSLGLIGMTGSDLYALRLNFVFGIGLFNDRAGVYSLNRFGEQKRPLLRRTLQLATHELGHMFHLKHCVFYKCVMNGTNSLREADRQPLHLCPVCLAKLHHALGFEPVARYRRLARFFRRQGLSREAAFALARARELSD